MGFSLAVLPRGLFLLLLLLIFCSSEAEVVTVDVHGAKDLIKSGYKFLDVRFVNGALSSILKLISSPVFLRVCGNNFEALFNL